VPEANAATMRVAVAMVANIVSKTFDRHRRD
jgi:hypothetical protein